MARPRPILKLYYYARRIKAWWNQPYEGHHLPWDEDGALEGRRGPR